MPPFGMPGIQVAYFLAIEILYFLAVAGLCLAIYFKTRGIYNISKHRGIFHFRNIFLYFSLAYFFRFIYMLIFLLYGLSGVRGHFTLPMISFLLIGYFSTMAILSVVVTVLIRKINIDDNRLNNSMHIAAILLSVTVFLILSPDLLVVFQTLLFLIPVLFILFIKPKKQDSHLSTQNRITYLSLFIFWVINLFAFSRNLLPMGFEIILYIVSVGIFLSIYLRVKKRLENEEKKKQAGNNK